MSMHADEGRDDLRAGVLVKSDGALFSLIINNGLEKLSDRRRFRHWQTSVCRELQRRGCHAIDGRRIAYRGDQKLADQRMAVTSTPSGMSMVKALVADQHEAVTFFCGGWQELFTFHRSI